MTIKKEYKLIIAGGRDFCDYEKLKIAAAATVYNINAVRVTVISGTALGADRLGEVFAKELNLPLMRFPADWSSNGKAAGYIRNRQMAEVADGLLAFWDGKSKGTKHMIDIATKKGLDVKVVRYE